MTESNVPPLSRGVLDRAAHRRADREWLEQAWLKARVFVVDDGHVLVTDEPQPRLVYLDPAQAPAGERFFLGEDEDTAYFAVAATLGREPNAAVDGTAGAGARRVTLREGAAALGALESGLFVTAVALANWHARHPFSPLTGEPTQVGEGGWTRVTADAEQILWPRTDPAVIMLVHDGVDGPEGRCLLGCNAAWPTQGAVKRYSTLAGFVEPGESAEMAVAREVAEEVGVEVFNIRYVSSQPWPFPASLMLGYHAQAAVGAPITVDTSEIKEARWFSRAEIGGVLDGSKPDFGLPFGISIAFFLLVAWFEGRVSR